MNGNQIPTPQHLHNQNWSYFIIGNLIMYYKVIQDLPNNDLKVCVIPVEDGMAKHSVYEAHLIELLEDLNIPSNHIKEVDNKALISQLEFIYEGTYDSMNGKLGVEIKGHRYLH
jgi:hypothetical protein